MLSETAREKVLISSVLDMLRRMRAAAVLGGLQQLRPEIEQLLLEIEQLLPDCGPVSATCWYMPGMYRAVRACRRRRTGCPWSGRLPRPGAPVRQR